MQKDNGYYRYQHKKHALRHRNITRFVYKVEDYFSDFNKYDSFKIHCSCPMCASKTRGLVVKKTGGPGENWSIRDEKRIEEMDDQLLDEDIME